VINSVRRTKEVVRFVVFEAFEGKPDERENPIIEKEVAAWVRRRKRNRRKRKALG
jgi:hypothetical protein